MLNKCWQQSDWINHFSMSMSCLPVFFDQMFWAEWDISKEATTWIPLICQHFPCDQYVTRWSFLYKRFTGVPTVCQLVFTTPGSLRNHSKIHTGATSCSRCSHKLAMSAASKGTWKASPEMYMMHFELRSLKTNTAATIKTFWEDQRAFRKNLNIWLNTSKKQMIS